METAEVTMGNFKLISLGACQMINVYSQASVLKEVCV